MCSVHWGMFSTSGGHHEYIGGTPWVHRGDTMSTSGGVQYIGGTPWVHRGMFSTSEGYHEYIGGYHEYIGRCSVHWEDIMMHVGGYHDACGGIPWVHREMFSTSGGYHEYIVGDIMSTSGGYPDVQYIGVFNRNWKVFTNFLPHMHHDIPPMYSWYPPNVLMVSLQCTEHPPMYSWYPPTCIMISPRCTHDIPTMYSWDPHNVLIGSPQCTEHPPMYWTSADILNISRCTEHTLYRVIKDVRSWKLLLSSDMKLLTRNPPSHAKFKTWFKMVPYGLVFILLAYFVTKLWP